MSESEERTVSRRTRNAAQLIWGALSAISPSILMLVLAFIGVTGFFLLRLLGWDLESQMPVRDGSAEIGGMITLLLLATAGFLLFTLAVVVREVFRWLAECEN